MNTQDSGASSRSAINGPLRFPLQGAAARARRLLGAAAAVMLTLAAVAAPAQKHTPVPPVGPAPAVPAPSAPASEAPAPASPVPAAAAMTAADVDAWLDGYLPYALKTGDIAGAVVAVVKDGEILTARGFGYADVAAKKPVDPKLTLFRPGSVSKLFTWTAVMQQVEQGKIDLDADVNKYIDFKIPPYEGKPITMRNLMQHTAGFEEQAKGTITEKVPPGGFVALLKAWTPERVFAPGSTPAYSNYGASLAGYIVQRVSGESFDDYIERHIFEPLEMKHSTFRQPLPKELAPLMSNGYLRASEEPRPFEIVGPAPAGSLSSPGTDMANFMIAHLQGGEFHGKRILSAATAEMMHNSPLTMLPPLNRMELGFFETNINDREVIAHLGDTEYFHTSLHLFLKENVGFYVSFNSLGKEGAADGLRTALFQDFADRYFPVAPVTTRVDEKTAREHAAMLTGTWVNSRGSKSNFIAVLGLVSQLKVGMDKKGELVTPGINALDGKPRHWVEVTPFLWIDSASHDRLAAKIVDGKAVRWSFDLLSPFMVFERVPWYANNTWLKPLLVVSLAALLLTAVLWPVTAVIRRRYRAPLALDPESLKAYRLSKIGAIAILAGLLLWVLVFSTLLKASGDVSDALIWLAEIVGTILFIGGLVLMLWNLRAVWLGARRWPAKVWSIVLTVSALTVLWAAVVGKLISFGANY